MKKHLLLLVPALVAGSLAQDTAPGSDGADPFSVGSEASPATVEPAPDAGSALNLSLCYETFSLPLAQAARFQRQRVADPELYERLVAMTEQGAAAQETFTMLRLRSGERASSESVGEQIYPTEYEPAELPNNVGIGVAAKGGKDSPEVPDPPALAAAPPVASIDGLRTPATATSFESRNVGLTLEAEATTNVGETIVDLRLDHDHVTLVDRLGWGQEISEVEFPEFERRGGQSGVTLAFNRPFLLGTVNRPPVSKVDPDSASRVCFAFVTVTKARP